MAGKYPVEFREDVVAVAKNREAGVSLKQIAADFGISYATQTNWMRQDATDAGEREGLMQEWVTGWVSWSGR